MALSDRPLPRVVCTLPLFTVLLDIFVLGTSSEHFEAQRVQGKVQKLRAEQGPANSWSQTSRRVRDVVRTTECGTQACIRTLCSSRSPVFQSPQVFLNAPASTSGEREREGIILCILGSRTFVSMSWMCKKQTPLAHSSTESEVIPLDAGLRMGVLPLLTYGMW